MKTLLILIAFGGIAYAQSPAPSASSALTKEEIIARAKAKIAEQRAAEAAAIQKDKDEKEALKAYYSELRKINAQVVQNVGSGLIVKIGESERIFLRGVPNQEQIADTTTVYGMFRKDGIYQYQSVGAGLITLNAYRYECPIPQVKGYYPGHMHGGFH